MNVINMNPDIDFGFTGSDADFPVREVELTAATAEVTTHKAIVRADTDEAIGVVGTDYKLMPNSAFYEGIEGALNKTLQRDKTDDFKVSTSTARFGAYTERRYVFPAYSGRIETNTGWNTTVGFQVIAWNSYDGGSSAGMVCGLIDFFCHNGMVSGENIDSVKKRHSSGLVMDHFVPLLETNITRMQQTIAEMNAMAQTDLDMDAAKTLLEKMFSERRAEAMTERLGLEIAERGSNVFALHSALTYYASHNSDDFPVRRTGKDNVASTLANRRSQVTSIIRNPMFRNLIGEAA